MIPKHVMRKLRANWGSRSEALDCFAEIKFEDKAGGWAWYILAVNPDDDDTTYCVVDEAGEVRVCTWTLTELERFYNRDGESPEIDAEYRPIKADVLYRKLMGNT